MTEAWVPKKPHFGGPPPGYIAGLGRGATGFITRSDLGPVRANEPKNIQAAQVEDANYTQTKFDNWQGYKGALFSKGNLDEEDRLAEQAYDFCEKRVYERRDKNANEQKEKLKNKPPVDSSITSKFVDLKRQLANISTEEWQGIPECIDLSIKKRKKERYAPVPDALVMNLLVSKDTIKTVDINEQNIQDFHEAKEVLLKSKLDNLENTSSVKPNFDKIGYITQLNSKKLDSQFLGDVKKARVLLKSALATNPKNPDIWLSAARIEQLDGKINDCRLILRKAIESCPLSEDLWIQLSRIQKSQQSKDVLIEGLRFLPSSQKLWLYAAGRQNQNRDMKSKILRKGLQNIPTSVKLWRQLIQMESVDEAKQLLYKAVQSLPKQIDLWLALAKVQDYDSAKKVLNKARKCNPMSLAVWISGARLEQAQSKVQHIAKVAERIESVLIKGRQILKSNGANITRQQWLQEAIYGQKSGSLIVCQVLVKISAGYGLTQQEMNNVILKDVKLYQKQRECNHTVRFIFKYGILLTKNKEIMKQMIEFQNRMKLKKEYEELNQTLKFALQVFENNEQFVEVMIIKLIKEKTYESALAVIETASEKISKKQEEYIRLFKVKIYVLQQQYEKARKELKQLREKFPNGKAILQSIKLQFQMGDYEQAWRLCQRYFRESKQQGIWEMAFRIKEKIGGYPEAYAIIEKATLYFPESINIWKDFIQFELSFKHISKARALIDKAIQKIPKNEQIYLIAILLQRRSNNKKQALFSLAKALKVYPKSAEIWALAIELEPQNTRKKKASSAIQICGQSPFINSSIAKLFWKQNKMDKAKRWFEQALKMNPNNGDIWALYVRLLQIGYPLQKEEAINRFLSIEGEMQGRNWSKIKEKAGNWKLQNLGIVQLLMKEAQNQINQID